MLEELRAIRAVLQDLAILECARAGIPVHDVRRIVPVDKTKISRITKHLKNMKA